jgi:hypothetical protein
VRDPLSVPRAAVDGRGRRLAAALVLALALLGVSRPAVPADPSPEYVVKAAYLYNFARYVEWPSPALARGDGKLVVCVLGQDPFGAVLDRTLAGKAVDGRPLAAQRCASADDVAHCHLLFVGSTEELGDALRLSRTANVLTIGDADDFLRRGGMIQLLTVDNRVRFAINLGAIERAGLKISSEVLKLATDVTR